MHLIDCPQTTHTLEILFRSSMSVFEFEAIAGELKGRFECVLKEADLYESMIFSEEQAVWNQNSQ